MKGKNLLLLKELMEECHNPDNKLHDELVHGFMLTGTTSYSGDLFKRVVPASVTEQQLRQNSQWQRAADNLKSRSALNIDVVREQTLAERDLGWISGPFTSNELDRQFGTWVSHRRFGL